MSLQSQICPTHETVNIHFIRVSWGRCEMPRPQNDETIPRQYDPAPKHVVWWPAASRTVTTDRTKNIYRRWKRFAVSGRWPRDRSKIFIIPRESKEGRVNLSTQQYRGWSCPGPVSVAWARWILHRALNSPAVPMNKFRVRMAQTCPCYRRGAFVHTGWEFRAVD